MEKNKTTKLDDIAYSLYYNEHRIKVLLVSNDYFIIHKDIFKNYYSQANIILRKEKLNKINEKR